MYMHGLCELFSYFLFLVFWCLIHFVSVHAYKTQCCQFDAFHILGFRATSKDCKTILYIIQISVQIIDNYHIVISTMILSRFSISKLFFKNDRSETSKINDRSETSKIKFW